MPPKRKASTSPPPSCHIFCSAPISDRLSTFVAHYSTTLSAKQLQADTEFTTASHRVAAWRIASKQQRIFQTTSQTNRQIFETGYDDDGEQYAGKRLEKLLDVMKVEGAVVVARWYGGVMLGPVRFTHIENCARDAIMKCRSEIILNGIPQKQQNHEEDEEETRKKNLEFVLEQRDQNINTLRLLLAEKKGDVSNTSPVSSPLKRISYDKMSLIALLKLEKARDATIAWLLQEITKAEQVSVNAQTLPNAEDKCVPEDEIATTPNLKQPSTSSEFG